MKVSVVIPAYNAEQTIKKCITSVLDQTRPVFEIIVVDDGSVDRTLDIVQNIRVENKLPIEIHILNQTNQGPSAARNAGIDIATGDWIAFLDSDDQWHPSKNEWQADVVMIDRSIALCGGLYGHVNIDQKKPATSLVSFKKHLFKPHFNTPTVLVRAELLRLHKFNERQHYSEDYRLWLEINRFHKCVLVNKILAKNVFEKSIFGASGLSGNLWQMEIGELSNYRYLYSKNQINFFEYFMASTYSLAKFFRRFILSRTQNIPSH